MGKERLKRVKRRMKGGRKVERSGEDLNSPVFGRSMKIRMRGKDFGFAQDIGVEKAVLV